MVIRYFLADQFVGRLTGRLRADLVDVQIMPVEVDDLTACQQVIQNVFEVTVEVRLS